MTDFHSFIVKVQVNPKNIDFLNRVFEAYDNLAVVTTENRHEGILLIRGFGKVSVIRRILRGLPFRAEILEEITDKEIMTEEV